MYNLPATAWAWVPIALAVLLSLAAGVAALAKPASEASPRPVDRRFFEGPGLTNSGAVSTVLALLPLLLSADVREDVPSASMLGAATLLFSLTTFLGMWLYSTVAGRKVGADGRLLLTSNLLVVVQGVIVSCMIVAVGCFIAFILVAPMLGPRHDKRAVPKAVFLKCTPAGCTLDAGHRS